MSLTPCIITHIKTGKVVSVNEALEIVRQDPKLWVKAMKGEVEAPKATKKKVLKFKNDSEAQVFLDEAGIDEEQLPFILNQYGFTGKNLAKTVNAILASDVSEVIEVGDDASLKKAVNALKEAVSEAQKANPKEFLQSLIDKAEETRAELRKPGFNDILSVAGQGLLEVYIGILKAAQAAGRYITKKQAMAEARASLKDKHSEAELDNAQTEIEKKERERFTSSVKKAAGVRARKNSVQAAIDKAFAVGMGYGKQEGFVKGATEGGKAGFVTGLEEGRKQGFQKGATEGGRAGFVAGKEEGFKSGFTKGATEGQKSGFVTGKEVGFEQGERSGIKEGKIAAAKTMKAVLEGLETKLSPTQITGLLDRFAKIKDFSPESKQRFYDYAFKVVEDANYVLKERAGTKLKARVAQLSKSDKIPANDQTLYRKFSDLSINHMEPEVLDKYIEWGNKIVGKALNPGDRAAITDFIQRQAELQQTITAERSAKAKEGRERNLKEEFDELKKEGRLPSGVSTYEQYVESKKPKSKAETREQKEARTAQAIARLPQGTEYDRIFKDLKNTDLSLLSTDQLEAVDNILNNYEDTGLVYGLGGIAVDGATWTEIAKLKAEGNVFNQEVDIADARKQTLTGIFNKFLNLNSGAAKMRKVIIQPWLSKSSNVYLANERAEKDLLEAAFKNRLKEADWNTIDLFGFLNEAEGNPELFKELAAQKLQDVETIASQINDKDKSISMDVKRDQLKELQGAIAQLGLTPESTLEQVRSRLSKGQLAVYDKAREMLDKYAPTAIRNIELYSNKEVEAIKNYWPRNATRLKMEGAEVKDKVEDFSGFDDFSGNVGKNLFGRQKGRVGLIGDRGFYEPNGQINLFNGLRETMMISEAAHEYYQMKSVFNSDKGFSELVKGLGSNNLKELFVEWVMSAKNHGRFSRDNRNMASQFMDWGAHVLTGAIIKNPTQLPKQLSALAFPATTAPAETLKAMDIVRRMVADKAMERETPLLKAYRELANNSTLALRLAIPETQLTTERYIGDKSLARRAFLRLGKATNTVFGGELITEADKMASIGAMLSGYIQNQVERGVLKSAKDFDLVKEAKQGFDMEAIAAAEQLQGKTNNENSRLFYSKDQRDAPAAYWLSNFTYGAVRNLYNNLSKAVNTNKPAEERAQAAREVAAYAMQATAFAVAGYASTQLVNWEVDSALKALFDWDDDDELKEAYLEQQKKNTRDQMIVREMFNGALGTQNIYVQFALQTLAAAAFTSAQEMARAKAKGEGFDVEGWADKNYKILYEDNTVGKEGLMVDNIIKPLEGVGKVFSDKKQEEGERQLAFAGAVLALSLMGQSTFAFTGKKIESALKRHERAGKAQEKALKKEIESTMNAEGIAESEARKKFSRYIDYGNDAKAIEAFRNMPDIQKYAVLNSVIAEDIPVSLGRLEPLHKYRILKGENIEGLNPQKAAYLRLQYRKLRDKQLKTARIIDKANPEMKAEQTIKSLWKVSSDLD